MFPGGPNRWEGDAETNKVARQSHRCAELAAAVIDDEVSMNVLKRASGQTHQSQAGTQINTISFLFSLPAAFFLGNEQTWHDISFCNFKGGGEFILRVKCDQN